MPIQQIERFYLLGAHAERKMKLSCVWVTLNYVSCLARRTIILAIAVFLHSCETVLQFYWAQYHRTNGSLKEQNLKLPKIPPFLVWRSFTLVWRHWPPVTRYLVYQVQRRIRPSQSLSSVNDIVTSSFSVYLLQIVLDLSRQLSFPLWYPKQIFFSSIAGVNTSLPRKMLLGNSPIEHQFC